MSSTSYIALSDYETVQPIAGQLVAWSRLPSPSLMLMVGEAERRDRFGHALQQALERRGVSERELAKRLEVDPRKVARWRRAKALPDYYETQEIAAILRVSEDLFRHPPEVPKPPTYPIDQYLLENAGKDDATATG